MKKPLNNCLCCARSNPPGHKHGDCVVCQITLGEQNTMTDYLHDYNPTATKLRRLLKRLEWSAPTRLPSHEIFSLCPLCRGVDPYHKNKEPRWYTYGHRNDCELDAEIALLPKEVEVR